MKTQALLTWALAGGLLASTGLNLHLARRVEALTVPEGTSANAEKGEKGEKAGKAAADTTAAGNAEKVKSLVDGLRLTKEQCERIMGCSQTCKSTRSECAREALEASEELHEELFAEKPVDEERIFLLADEISKQRSQEFKRLVRSILHVRAALTPEQVRTLASATTR